MISRHPVKFGDHRSCGSVYIMFSMIKEQDFTCCCLNPPLQFMSI